MKLPFDGKLRSLGTCALEEAMLMLTPKVH